MAPPRMNVSESDGGGISFSFGGDGGENDDLVELSPPPSWERKNTI